MMNVIGQQIKKFRIEKGYTQEQLGQLLGVSIDALFGNNDESELVNLSRRLSRMSSEDTYRHAFHICWAIEVGLMKDVSLIDQFIGFFSEKSGNKTEGTDYYSKLMKNGGISTARISADFRHFFLMTEPAGSIRDHIGDLETLHQVFTLFADKKFLKIIFYMYSRLNTPVAASMISHHTGIGEEELNGCMEKLCKNRLAVKTVIATLDGELDAYQFSQESSVIPLLCFADEIAKRDYCDFMIAFDRTKPLL